VGTNSYDRSVAGTYGTLYLDSASGAYEFVADDAAIEGRTSDASQSFTLTVTDAGGESASQLFTVNITAANDTPVLTASLTDTTYVDTAGDDTFDNVTGTLSTSDRDTEAETATYSIAGQASGTYTVGTNSYDRSVAGTYGTLYLDSASGAYEFVADDAAIEGRTSDASQSFTLTVTDAGGESASQLFTVNITAANDTPVLTASLTDTTYVDTAGDDTFDNVTGTLSTSDRDTEAETATYSIAGQASGTYTVGTNSYDRSVAGTYGTLYLDSASGAYEFVADDAAIEGRTSDASQSFTLTVTDAGGESASQLFTVNITAANDTPVLTASLTDTTYVDTAGDDTFDNVTGTLSTSDRDTEAETATYSIAGQASGTYTVGTNSYDRSVAGTYGTLYLDSASGAYEFVADDAAIEGRTSDASQSFTLTVTDAGGESASQLFTVNITAANDTPVLTASLTDTTYVDTAGDDTFDNVTGTLSTSDRDTEAETATYSIAGQASGTYTVGTNSYDRSVAGTYGTLYLDSASGAYEFVADDAAIEGRTSDASQSFTLTVTDAGGESASQLFTVNITAANDTPVLTASLTDTTYVDTAGDDTFDNVTGTLSTSDRTPRRRRRPTRSRARPRAPTRWARTATTAAWRAPTARCTSIARAGRMSL
jgi:VCBS repeat-containing protein